MIQLWIRNQLEPLLPKFNWTVDFEATGDLKATVYYEGGADVTGADLYYRHPRYMVWIESTDWGLAEFAAYAVFRHLSGIQGVFVPVEYSNDAGEILDTKTVYLKNIEPSGEPNRMGVEDGRMIYSINFDALITNTKEEKTDETI